MKLLLFQAGHSAISTSGRISHCMHGYKSGIDSTGIRTAGDETGTTGYESITAYRIVGHGIDLNTL